MPDLVGTAWRRKTGRYRDVVWTVTAFRGNSTRDDWPHWDRFTIVSQRGTRNVVIRGYLYKHFERHR